MKIIFASAALIATAAFAPTAMATDLAIAYQAKDATDFDRTWVIQDVKAGDSGLQQVKTSDGTVLKIGLEIKENEAGTVVTTASVYEVKPSIRGRTWSQLLSQQEIKTEDEDGARVTFMLGGWNESDSSFRIELTPYDGNALADAYDEYEPFISK